jgi:hypothetical protein
LCCHGGQNSTFRCKLLSAGAERFYNDLIDVFWRNHFGFWTEACRYLNEPYIPKPDVELVVFEDIIHADPAYPEPVHELLMHLIEKGWQIVMNFMAPDCILGNVAVKLGDKWIAIGECRKTRRHPICCADMATKIHFYRELAKRKLN